MMNIETFISKWKNSGAAERANYQLFLRELAVLIGAPEPNETTGIDIQDTYVFDKSIKDNHSNTTKFIDLFKSKCFVLEAKQGSDAKKTYANKMQMELISGEELPEQTRLGTAKRGTPAWAKAMSAAKQQAYNYARALDTEEGWPPFLIVVDIGHVIELYSDFTGTGKNYTQFQDGMRFRIEMDDLRDENIRETLRFVWTDPHALDPAKKTAKVTRQIAEQLAELGKSFEGQGHDSELVARFLMRCLFTMFAEDVELIKKDSFTKLLQELRGNADQVQPTLENLWQTMDKGGFSPVLRDDLLRFNGGLFKEATALPINSVQLSLLINAAEADWRDVEPAIFGTLLERALSKRERHKLGAHYTPRAYVERLVTPTIVEPLREDWDATKAAAFMLLDKGDKKKAIETVQKYHRDLCGTKVLDPACGSGNFLYIALEQMKRLEGEVIGVLRDFGFKDQAMVGFDDLVEHKFTVDPHQFLGIELNPWAANVAELVLWIGYLQWHFKTFGKAAPSEPVLRDFHNIENRDAILEWETQTPRMDEDGNPVTRWDGVTMMRHQVTGEEVPDPSARVQVYDYAKPKATVWPQADFIVGNPPFIGAARMRDDLGDGYTEAVRAAHPKLGDSIDLVMYWWDKAAKATKNFDASKKQGTRRFGLITTNSLRQAFNRRVLEPYLNDSKKPLSLLFAIPDHPWVDSKDGAAVRIAMTVSAAGNRAGRLLTIATESKEKNEADGLQVTFDHQIGKIFANLQIGADVAGAKALLANSALSARGSFLIGKGFLGTETELKSLAEGTNAENDGVIRPFLGGYDLSQRHRRRWVIDFWDMHEDQCRSHYPALYQRVLDTVKPVRDENPMQWRRENWWVFGDPSRSYRAATRSLENCIVTSRTAKFRCFQLWSTIDLCESEVVVVGLDEPWALSVLSSKFHEVWSLAICGWMGVGNDPRYNNSRIFDPFPFPDNTIEQRTRLRALGEKLDAHRKRQQAAHPNLTLTQMYNVLEKLRAGEVIEGKDREIYDQGLIGILKDLHDQIDAAVAEAYGWPVDLSEENILHRLVKLNKERFIEEATGKVRWLRPEYQNPTGAQSQSKSGELDIGEQETTTGKIPWPKDLPQQMAAIRSTLQELGIADVEQVRSQFARAQTKTIKERLDTLAMLGQATLTKDGKYTA